MICPKCRNELENSTFSARRETQDGRILFTHVPALICRNEHCRHVVLGSRAVYVMEQALPRIQDFLRTIGIGNMIDFRKLSHAAH